MSRVASTTSSGGCGSWPRRGRSGPAAAHSIVGPHVPMPLQTRRDTSPPAGSGEAPLPEKWGHRSDRRRRNPSLAPPPVRPAPLDRQTARLPLPETARHDRARAGGRQATPGSPILRRTRIAVGPLGVNRGRALGRYLAPGGNCGGGREAGVERPPRMPPAHPGAELAFKHSQTKASGRADYCHLTGPGPKPVRPWSLGRGDACRRGTQRPPLTPRARPAGPEQRPAHGRVLRPNPESPVGAEAAAPPCSLGSEGPVE